MKGWGVALVTLVACAGPARPRRIPAPLPASPAAIDRAVIAAEVSVEIALADRACACTDLACLDEVEADERVYRQTESIKSWVTETEPRPEDLRDLGDAATGRRVTCIRHLGAWSYGWTVTDVRDAAAIRDAACACQDLSCTHRMKDVVVRYRAAQISLALPGSEDRVAWDRAGAETDVCINEPLAREALIGLVAIRDEACACEDAACVAPVRTHFQQWVTDSQSITETAEVTEAKLTDLATQIEQCVQGAMRP